MVTENTTPNRGYQEPADGNTLEVDVGRLIAALRAIDVDVADALAQIVAKAGLNSPAFTGTPTAPTAAPGTDSGQLATTAFVRAAVAALVDSSPGALDTLNELAAALGDDPNFSTTVLDAIGTKADEAATTAALAGKADASALAAKADASTTNINALTAKTTPVDADELRLADSAASFGFKKLTFANLKAWINAFLGASGSIPTGWVVYTPIFVGFGTVEVQNFRSRRVGSNLEIIGTFTAGTVSATTATVTLGFNGVNGGLTVASWLTPIAVVGPAAQGTTTGALSLTSLALAGDSVLKIGYQGTGGAGLAPMPGNYLASGAEVSIQASIPIEGW